MALLETLQLLVLLEDIPPMQALATDLLLNQDTLHSISRLLLPMVDLLDRGILLLQLPLLEESLLPMVLLLADSLSLLLASEPLLLQPLQWPLRPPKCSSSLRRVPLLLLRPSQPPPPLRPPPSAACPLLPAAVPP